MPSEFTTNENIPTFCDLVMILEKFENQLQAIREIITQRTDFYPEALFNHLSLNDSFINRQNIINFLEENGRPVKEQQIRILFSLYGYRDKMSYRGFLNYIFPFGIEAIKNISLNHAKRYVKPEQKTTEQILALFIILLQKEVEFIHCFEEAKTDVIPNASRESLKKLMKNLKKYTSHTIHGLQSDYVLTTQQFMNVFKKQKQLTQKNLIPVCRRLSMQKDSFIGLDQFEIWLKPWNKIRSDEPKTELSTKKTLFDDIEDSLIAS